MSVSSSATFSAFCQPSMTGRVMPLSWSVTRETSPEGDGAALDEASVDWGGADGSARVPGSFASPPVSSNAPVTATATTTTPAATSATVFARPPPPGCGCGCLRAWVHAAPSHQRSVDGALGSGYQPGGGSAFITAE